METIMAFIGNTKTSLGLMCLQLLCLFFVAFLPCTFLSVLGDSMRTEIFRQYLHHLKFSWGFALRSDERNNNTTSSRNQWIVVNERSNSSKESKSAWDEESVTPYPESHFLHMHVQERFVAVHSLDGQIYLFTPLYPDREWKIIEMPTDTTCGVPKGTRDCLAHSCCQTKRLFIGMDVDLH